jgi:DNA repair protein RadA/Sms
MRSRESRGSVFVCNECGYRAVRWEGRCPGCEEWGTLGVSTSSGKMRLRRGWVSGEAQVVQELKTIEIDESERLSLSYGEINRVLGGGLVPGSVALLAGEPGIGKSTMLLQVAQSVASNYGKTLYISGEESPQQLRLRSQRLGISGEGILVFCETDLETILTKVEEIRPSLVVVDSIQTMEYGEIETHPGSIAQIRESTRLLMQKAKASGVTLILAGHVTKDGDIAGPRVLEHMVDVVLSLEGDRLTSLRLLRGMKNRFGSTSEVGVFQMETNGLVEVIDPSRIFTQNRSRDAIGSVLVPTQQGIRPMLVEVQALTSPSASGSPRRVASGIEFNRLLLITSVLSQREGFPLASQDVIVNVAGGLRVTEPAADLGIALAIISSVKNMPPKSDLAAIGELGLSGEVRTVTSMDRRLGELARLGISKCLVPSIGIGDFDLGSSTEIVPVSNLKQALSVAFASGL